MIYLTMNDIKPFTPTPIDEIKPAYQKVFDKFHTHSTRSVDWRLKQLRSFYWGLKDAEPAFMEALKLDLGKSAYESYLTEVGWVLNDIVFMQKNLKRWAADERAEDTALMNLAVTPKIRKDPLGVVLIIGAFNFPVQLSIGPLIGAIAAGCTAILKPSEGSPHTARVMQHVIETSLDPTAFRVVQGAVPETTALLDLKWDKIFYTGGQTVGKIIATKAAASLTPVVLELGGRNPAIVTRNADLRLAARRLIWAKLMNAGQVCVSQNYIIVDREILPSFVKYLELALKDFHPKGAEGNDDYGKIVNERSWSRLKGMLDNTKGRILLGGKTDKATLFFEPTVVEVTSQDDSLLKDESFGPLIPVIAVSNLDEAIKVANQVDPTPLGIYPFGTSAEAHKVLGQTRSGGASINDGFFHASIPTLSFGGVGDSGTGSYRGKASFEAFTHRRSYTTTPSWIEMMLDVRYPPYTNSKLARFRAMNESRPNFDRAGNPSHGFVWALVGLGSKSKAMIGSFITKDEKNAAARNGHVVGVDKNQYKQV